MTCPSQRTGAPRAGDRLDGCVAFPALRPAARPDSRTAGRRGRRGARRAHRPRPARPGRPPGGRDGAAAALPGRPVRHLHPGPEAAQPGRGRPGPERLRGEHRRRAGRLGQAALVRQEARGPRGPRGVYLDGGYGVGKTHLLASLWHATPAPAEHKAFGTFVELTNLVGALGFQQTVRTLGEHKLLCIDEFELDDPGDTVLVSTLLGKLVDAGVALAATSNTLPGKLGEGRFAAADFLREIQGLSAHFRPLRIDGEDYRHRGLPEAPAPYDDETVTRTAYRTPGASLDDFPSLLEHLSRVHPSRYGAMCDGIEAVCLTDVQAVPDQSTALRLVVLADRLYDREVPVLTSGKAFDELFSEEMLRGGYRKKYFRAISRLTALARDAGTLVADGSR
ncbi:cell division protein ZapE [Streptomyces sp. 2224.1]|nr:cell division protein ZapE [Streptomyces sp. 2224.1]